MRRSKIRLDQHLAASGQCESREQAKRLILAGEVTVDGEIAAKPGMQIKGEEEIVVKAMPRFAGRGGLKLEAALDGFSIGVEGAVGADIGSSTGGFTDCLLQRGAAKVFAIDVGTNQLAWRLRSDPRVEVMEQCNARHLSPGDLPGPVDIVVIDVSFISLKLILGPAFGILKPGGDLVCLIKPQFEVKRGEVGKGGIVRDETLHRRVVAEVKAFVEDGLHKVWKGSMDSPISGTGGNREFLAWLRQA